MNRLLPMPWISLALLLAWPLLVDDRSLLVWVGAVFFALGLPLLLRGMVPPTRPASNVAAILRLFLRVLVDIVVSNVGVARLVLGRMSALRPAIVEVPVGTDHPVVLNLLASIITMTPGTVSARVDTHEPGSRPTILVHVLDCEDGAALVDDIKARYEKPLLEIFRCSTLP